MKYLNSVWLGTIALTALVSCVDYTRPEFDVEVPESIAAREALNNYDVLKSYVDREASPGFILGSGVTVSDYSKRGLIYSIISSNFDEVTAGYAMKHGAGVADDGTLNLAAVADFLAAAEEAELTVYGHTLCWHANQNADYLNSTIAPVVIPGTGVAGWDTVVVEGFETAAETNYQYANAVASFTADGEGAHGEGRALKLVNEEVREFDYGSQFFIKFSPSMEVGERYRLTMDVRADEACSYSTQAHRVPYEYLYWDFFGSIDATTGWTQFVKEVTVSENTVGTGAIAYNLGLTATAYYVDNIVLERYSEGGGETIEKTDEEKKEIITGELERWIAGMMEISKEYVKAWDVVNEPMDDGKPYQLKTGVGRDLNSDEFYWQDYLGKDYAVMAFNLARQYGNEDDILFINDYNLEYNLDKCKGIIEFVEYIESKGVTVDGIGTQMHISTDSDKDKIAEMFTLLAATGKLIKISELDLGVGVKTTAAKEEHYIAQAEMYEYVVSKYLELIPAAQQYGITVWSPFDSPANSSWRAGEPIGLWNLNYERKKAYAGFADGLMN